MTKSETTRRGPGPWRAWLAVLFLWPAELGSDTAGFGRIEGVIKGDRLAEAGDLQTARVIRGGDPMPARAGMSLLKGDRIATGPEARAVISLDAGWEVVVEAESELEILNPTIKVSYGRAILSAYRRIKEILKAQTEYVVAAPESTQYLVEVRGESFTLTVVRGRVRLESTTAAWPPSVYGPLERSHTAGRAKPQREAPLSNSEAAQILRDVERIRSMISPRMPNVVGRPREEAERILRAAGLEVQVTQRISGRGAAGTVISQEPEAGGELTAGRRASLLVEGSSCEVTIKDPAAGAKVGLRGPVTGTARISAGGHLWVLAHMEVLAGMWWPLAGPINVREDGTWRVLATYGARDDIGENFEIGAVVVDDNTHQQLLRWLSDGEAKKSFPPLPFPQPLRGCLPVTRIVIKTSH